MAEPKIKPEIAIAAPDIAPYRAGNTGIDYVTTFRAAAPGPHVMVSAVVHGNEICGAIALDHFFTSGIRPRRGAVTLAFCNVEAYRRFDPRNPGASRYVDEDFNRLWSTESLGGPRHSRELTRARAIRHLVDDVDLLLDIHSMQSHSGALVLSGRHAKGRALAAKVGIPRIVVSDSGHDAGKRMRDYGAFDDPRSPKNALLIECGYHWHEQTAATAIACLYRFLAASEVIDAADAARFSGPPTQSPQRFIEVTMPVTVRSAAFRFLRNIENLEVIAEAGTVFAMDGERPIATPYDNCVMVMPSWRLAPGGTAVRLGRDIGDK